MAEYQEGWSPIDLETSVHSASTGLPLLPPLPPLSVPSIPLPPLLTPPPLGSTGASDFSVGAIGRPSKGKPKLVALIVGLVVLVGAITGGAPVVFNNGSSSGAIQSPSAANSALYAAAAASGSFHYTGVTSGEVGGQAVTATQSGDAGRAEGVQYQTSSLGDYEVIVINSMAYMKADLTMLENEFGYSPAEAAPYVNRWISFTSSDSSYASVAADVTMETTWSNPSESSTDGLPHTPVSVSGVSTLNGQSVQSVRYSLHGNSKAASASYSGTETIFFSANGPHLPTQLTGQLSGAINQQSTSETVEATFSRWGQPVSITAPTGSIPYSTLPGRAQPRDNRLHQVESLAPAWHFSVVGTGVDPVTSRFSGARSTN